MQKCVLESILSQRRGGPGAKKSLLVDEYLREDGRKLGAARQVSNRGVGRGPNWSASRPAMHCKCGSMCPLERRKSVMR
jgi:hypothetical protein